MKNSKVNWRTHFIELLVVIIGISIAFTLEGWSDRKKESQLEDDYLSSLRSDLLKDADDMNAVIDSSDIIIRHVLETFQLTYSGAKIESFRRHHVTSTYTAPYFYSNDGSYTSMINSGNLDLIKDFRLKALLADLYNVKYKEVGRVDGLIRNLVDNMIYPYMIDNIQFSAMRDGIESATPLRTNKAVNLLGSYRNFLLKRKRAYQDVMTEAEEIVKIIDQKLN